MIELGDLKNQNAALSSQVHALKKLEDEYERAINNLKQLEQRLSELNVGYNELKCNFDDEVRKNERLEEEIHTQENVHKGNITKL